MNAINNKVPLFLDEQTQGWFVNIYASHGYLTKDSDDRRAIEDESIRERLWIGSQGSQARSLSFVNPRDLFKAAAVERLRRVGSDTVVISAFSHNLIRLHQVAPDCLEPLGKRTALLHLDRLSVKLARAESRPAA